MNSTRSEPSPVESSAAPEITRSTSPAKVTSRQPFLPPELRSVRSKTCLRCGVTKPQKSIMHNGATCRECYDEIRAARVSRLRCARCDREFDKPHYEINKAARRGHSVFYCGKECSMADHAVKNARKCRSCGKPMPGQRNNTYCSPACRAGTRGFVRTLVPIQCPVCQVQFDPKSHRTQHCSRACANKAHSRRMIGSGNSHFKDGKSYALWFDLMRPLVMERDRIATAQPHPCCAACLSPEILKPRRWRGKIVFRSNISIHHIDENPANNVADNLIALCQACHGVHHKSKMTPFRWFAAFAVIASRSMTSRWRDAITSLQAEFSPTTAS